MWVNIPYTTAITVDLWENAPALWIMYQDHVFFQETYTQSWSTSRGISSMVLIPIQLSAALSGFYRGTPILKQFTSVAMFVDQPKLGTV